MEIRPGVGPRGFSGYSVFSMGQSEVLPSQPLYKQF